MVNELKKMTERIELLTSVLKKKNANYYAPENMTKEENDLIYDNLHFFDGANWNIDTLENLISSNKKIINQLINNFKL